MRSCLTHRGKPIPWLRIGFVAALIWTSSGGTCTAVIGFNSCLGVPATPQITFLSPNAVSAAANSVLLTVGGGGFVPQSQILWNGSALPTTFADSHHLQNDDYSANLHTVRWHVRKSCPDFCKFCRNRYRCRMPDSRQFYHPGSDC